MLPLKSLAKILQIAFPAQWRLPPLLRPTIHQHHRLHPDEPHPRHPRPTQPAHPLSHQQRLPRRGVAGSSSSGLSALEGKEKALCERLMVLEEQRFFAGEMDADANLRRKFDEAASFGQNVLDLGGGLTRRRA